MKKYIFFIDVDNTLVKQSMFDMDEKIPLMFERIQAQGHIVAVVTGRALHAIYRIDGIEKSKNVCGLMGSVIVDGKTKEKIAQPTPMNKEIVQRFLSDVNLQGMMWTYKDDLCEKSIFDAPAIKKFSAKIVSKDEQAFDVNEERIFQLLVLGDLPQEIISKYPEFDFFKMPGGYYDVILKGSSKEKGVRYLKSLHPEHISVAIGDSNNDEAMFACCDIKIAMGNASDQIKQLATFVTKSIEECGVCHAIENILKI